MTDISPENVSNIVDQYVREKKITLRQIRGFTDGFYCALKLCSQKGVTSVNLRPLMVLVLRAGWHFDNLELEMLRDELRKLKNAQSILGVTTEE
jgi:hypothetical protein